MSSAASSRLSRLVIVTVLVLGSMTVAREAMAAETECEVITGPRLIECGEIRYQEVGLDAEWWRPLVALYFEPEDVDRAVCLMAKESGGDPGARNINTGAAGLMQVMPFWAGSLGYSYEDLFDPGINLWIASQIRDQQGWSAWSPYLRGSCR
jgi:soluble lytic murein transglycosylase-like protein